MSIVSQQTANMRDPKEHFAWALRNMPFLGGVGAITHPSYLAQWSEHLWNCGFVHGSVIEKLADENGMFDVKKLPKQTIKFQESERGRSGGIRCCPGPEGSSSRERIEAVRNRCCRIKTAAPATVGAAVFRYIT